MSSPLQPAPSVRSGIRRFWFDPRFVIGIVLVIVSLVGVWAVVQAATRSTAVYAAASTLTVGQRVTADDLTLSQVQLGSISGRYLEEGAIPADGLVVTRTVQKGELIATASVGTKDDVSVSALVIRSETPLAESVSAGALVDVWTAERDDTGTVGPPSVVVSGATVVRNVEEQSLVGDRGAVVEVLVPRGEVAAVLAALAREDAVSVVPAAGSW